MLKYKNKKVEYQGDVFDSQKELKHWLELKELEQQGKINNLQRQIEYQLIPRQTDKSGKFLFHPVKYVADMVYELQDGSVQVEDVKSAMTRKLPDYKIKRKLMYYIHGILVKEVK